MPKTTIRDSLFDAAHARHDYPWRTSLAGTILTGAGIGMGAVGWDVAAAVATGPGAVALAGAAGYWWTRKVVRQGASKRQVQRNAERRQRKGGTADRFDVAQRSGIGTMRLGVRASRPSLQGMTRSQIRRLPRSEVCVSLAYTGWGWLPGERVHTSFEETTLVVGGPRSGKTAHLACVGRDAPGALITTSTRGDLAEWVHEVRSRDGRAVHVWNPSGYVDIPSTVRWSVLSGCKDYNTAIRRATALLPSNGEGERHHWVTRARPVLALLMHAAAVKGLRMADVLRWVADEPTPKVPGKPVQRCQAERDVTEAVMSIESGGAMRAAQARTFWALADRTRMSVVLTMGDALDWMSHDQARELGDSPEETTTLNIRRLIEERETLHILGHESQQGLGPLNACLVDEIAEQARIVSGRMPAQRLDPPLTLVLDEAALVCPVPLDKWTADMGGRSVAIHMSVQSLAQLRQTWGDEGAGTIKGNTNNVVWFGGGANTEDLREISVLTGSARYRNIGEDQGAADSHRWAPVLDEAQLRELGPFEVLVLRKGMAPVLARIEPVWERDERVVRAVRWLRWLPKYQSPKRSNLREEIPAPVDTPPTTVIPEQQAPAGEEERAS